MLTTKQEVNDRVQIFFVRHLMIKKKRYYSNFAVITELVSEPHHNQTFEGQFLNNYSTELKSNTRF